MVGNPMDTTAAGLFKDADSCAGVSCSMTCTMASPLLSLSAATFTVTLIMGMSKL